MKFNNNISQEEFELIEAYLNNQLNTEDLAEFEKRLLLDNDFNNKVQDLKTILFGIETQALKEQLNQLHKNIDTEHLITPEKEVVVRRRSWHYMAIAAVLVIALGCFWFLGKDSNNSLYATYFTPDPGLPTTMSNEGSYEFYKAMVDYKQGNYNRAISSWQTQLLIKPENDTLNYFIGVALMANKNDAESIKYLQKTTELPANTFKNEAFFYLGLAYLKTDNQTLAIKALQQSSLPESADLLQKIN